MTSSLFHIYLDPKSGVSLNQIEKKMNLARDWFRYDEKNWIVSTTSDAKKWYSRLLPFVKPGGRVFIAELNMDEHWGFMSKELWQWIREAKK